MDKWDAVIKIMTTVKSILILKSMGFLALREMAAIYAQSILKDYGANMPALQDKHNICKLIKAMFLFQTLKNQVNRFLFRK
jgi:hypothetical protein